MGSGDPWPAGGHLDGVRGIPIAHHGADRPKRLNGVRLGPVGVGRERQWGQKRAPLRIRAGHGDAIRVAHHQRAGYSQGENVAAPVLALRLAHQRPHRSDRFTAFNIIRAVRESCPS